MKRLDSTGISLGKKALLVIMSLLILMVIELVLRLFFASPYNNAQNDPFLGFSSVNPLYEKYVAGDGSIRMKTAPGKLTWFNEQDFPLEKTADTFRIFTLGGSTTYGRPYADQTSFAGWARALLNADGHKGRKYEVINAGGISYASYRVRVIAEELLNYSPDLLIIYTGHNEFLEARTYEDLQGQHSLVFKIRKMLSGTRTYQVMKSTIKGTSTGGRNNNNSVLASEVRTMLDSVAGLELYVRDTLFSRGVYEHFRYNIQEIKKLCDKAGVPIVFLEPVDNIKDFSPFKSQADVSLSGKKTARITELVSEGSRCMQENDTQGAIEKFSEATELDSMYAESWFVLGRALLETGDTARAAEYLLRARELDVCPLRAPSPIHRILGEEMAGKDDPPLLDLPKMFQSIAPGGLIGRELLIDHVHPLPESNLRIALFILEWMIDSGYADSRLYPESDSQLTSVTKRVYDSLPEDYARNGVVKLARVLFWSKKTYEALSVLDEQWDLLNDSPQAQFLRGELMQSLGSTTNAVEHFRNAYELSPDERVIVVRLAETYVSANMADSAEALLKRSVAQYPDDAMIQAEYGMVLARQGNGEMAIRVLLKARHLEPDNEMIQFNIGNVYVMSGMLQRARRAYLEAIDQNPDNSDMWYNLANVNYQLEELELAEENLLRAIKLNPQNALAQLNLGNLYMETNRLELAESYYKKSLESDPDYPDTYSNLSKLYLKAGNDSLSAEYLERGRDRFPLSPLF